MGGSQAPTPPVISETMEGLGQGGDTRALPGFRAPEVTCTSRGTPGCPASTRERPRETFLFFVATYSKLIHSFLKTWNTVNFPFTLNK